MTYLNLSWMPGTTDRVRFTTAGQTYTVFLRDIEQETVHSAGSLYLKGTVKLPVSADHHAQLMGSLALNMTPERAR
ncbi:hypothetical protein [Deinococcus arcticus]|uniref:Uncharacterized protein n=1 Tax=Deinococcus arcticus TaxID=2136176 RepID=A0A2T3W9X2_9DEIO|nr:hypothetical protein [Deinococcus arcticus]PTA68637.1 hypothetical protein C8263_05120 [Deinococcus arcticus]